jgi:hypothetical protein
MMTIDLKTLVSQPPLPTRGLWRALLAIHNHFLVEKLDLLRIDLLAREVPPEVADAMRLLDCWLDVAIGEDWFGSYDPEA